MGRARSRPARSILAYDLHYRAGVALARTLWLQGHPAQAVERAHQAIMDAERMDHPASLAVVLAWAASVFLWTGDLRKRREAHGFAVSPMPNHIRLAPLLRSDKPARRSWPSAGAMQETGSRACRRLWRELHAVRYELLTTEFNISLAQGLAAIGRFAEGIALVDETIRRVEANGDVLYMPELLRVKGRPSSLDAAAWRRRRGNVLHAVA